jgi:hypothetical protein
VCGLLIAFTEVADYRHFLLIAFTGIPFTGAEVPFTGTSY